MAKIVNPNNFEIDTITKAIKVVEYPKSEPVNDYPTAVELYNYFSHVWGVEEKRQLLNKKLKKVKNVKV